MNTENTKWTPGPWELRHEKTGRRIEHVIKMGTACCYFNRGIGQTEEEAVATAKVISLLPEIVGALKECEERLCWYSSQDTTGRKARAILARINGEGGGA